MPFFSSLSSKHGFSSLDGLPVAAFDQAYNAYQTAKKEGDIKHPYLSVVDFNLPSNKKRLWVFDMAHHRVLYKKLVAHGQKSGYIYATHFSNTVGTHESSLGAFLTEGTYTGQDGYSLVLKGLDKGLNDAAERRHIIMHGSPYVNTRFAKIYGRVGRSWGCFALDRRITPKMINLLKGGSLLYAYHA